MVFLIETLGCKVNQYESQAMQQLLEARGHSRWTEDRKPDCVIVNTCAVTGESGRKSRQTIRRLQKQWPDAFVAVCGCYSQTCGDELDSLQVDLIGGSGSRIAFLDRLEQLQLERTPVVERDNPLRRRTFETLPAGSMDGRTRAMLKIQDGCSNFCTYCIIPYARGPVRSMPLEDISLQAAQLAEEGYKEIVITGIEISSFGRDLPGKPGLADALEQIAAAAPGVRLHLGSLEPRTITEDFCQRLKKLPALCTHFHLSLQSGCDATLARMKRRYDTARFRESVRLLRAHFPNAGITTDLITGFPGETEEEFTNTLAFIQDCAFSAMHVFPYSIRPGTPAADMPNQVEKAVKAERAARASQAASTMAEDFAQAQLGCTLQVLFETEKDGLWYGHSENYLEVSVPGEDIHGRVCAVEITGRSGSRLLGRVR